MESVDKQKMARLNNLSKKIVDCLYCVHRELGPGLLERAYHLSLCHELDLRNIKYQNEVYVPINYKDMRIESAYRLDLLIEDEIIIELKAVKKLNHYLHPNY